MVIRRCTTTTATSCQQPTDGGASFISPLVCADLSFPRIPRCSRFFLRLPCAKSFVATRMIWKMRQYYLAGPSLYLKCIRVHPIMPPPTLGIFGANSSATLPTYGGRDAEWDEILQFTRFMNLLTRAVCIKYVKYIDMTYNTKQWCVIILIRLFKRTASF